jgi:hypothetical protein
VSDISNISNTRATGVSKGVRNYSQKCGLTLTSRRDFRAATRAVRENLYVTAAKNTPLQFFDVNGSVARADCERGAAGIQFSAHGGMAQRAGNLNRDIQRDAAVAGVRVEHCI